MTTPAARFVVNESGRMVDAETERIAAIIQEYDPNLRLCWVPPERRAPNEPYPFAVIYDNPYTGEEEIALKVRETEVDHRIISKLFLNDNKQHNVLDVLEAEEAAARLVEMKRRMDKDEEEQELATWMVKARDGATLRKGVRLT